MSSDFECCEHTKLKLFVTKFLAGVHCISCPSRERFIPSPPYQRLSSRQRRVQPFYWSGKTTIISIYS